ncbi:MAG: D-alanyl-D-alanine carboxypeptidase [Gammaproteobacteria bacterium]|nr:D-alanyl-D-alanine carboxypeptidase [Gammaproteobacteria bacterium]MXZ32821.1 D-alanyl-D-alanine carboxypeptidase [Gammaproteobacteria bacterium]MYF00056.1 D-alanyl-D-alanine carboxypeptidase [Gammaproteobacteria bacterium]MYG96297.1 D-alanyl-D-alanine carboxypeptidase [Gammaproteobacteria bacterium]
MLSSRAPSIEFPAFGKRFLLPALFLAALVHAAVAAAQPIIPRPPEIAASSYILMDASTGHVILENNATEALPPASLTKIMTAYIAIEEVISGNLGLDEEVHISEKAWRMDGSKMFVGVDTYVSVEDLLRGIIIQSGNDASVAIAEHIAGSEDAFADMMNQYAEVLGLEQSYFWNSSGLDSDEQYNLMSARDLALLSRATIGNHPEFYPMYAEREFTYNDIRQPNRNTLLFRDRNVDGLKTGWTDRAGYCLVTSAERDGMRLIAVVMGTESENARAVETQKMLTYGFRYYETWKLNDSGQVLTSVPIWSGERDTLDLGLSEEVRVTIQRGRGEELEAAVNVDEIIYAPIEAGQIMGTVDITLDGEPVYSGEVAALQGVARGGVMKRMTDWFSLRLSNLLSN